MSIASFILPEYQYGGLPGIEDRGAAANAALSSQIIRSFFAGPDAEADYQRTVRRFATSLALSLEASGRNSKAWTTLAGYLGAPEPDPDETGTGVADEEGPVTRLMHECFLVVFFGFARLVAENRLGSPDLAAASEADTNDVDEDEEDPSELDDEDDIGLLVPRTDLIRLVERELRKRAYPVIREMSRLESVKEADRALLAVSGLCFYAFSDAMEGQVRLTARGEGVKLRYHLEIASEDTFSAVSRFFSEAPYSFNVQPLRRKPSYKNALVDEREMPGRRGSYVQLMRYGPYNSYLLTFRERFFSRSAAEQFYGDYVDGVDRVQAVDWRINRSVLATVRRLVSLVDDTNAGSADVPPELREWVEANLYRPASSRNRYELSAEFINHPLSKRVLDALVPGGERSLTFYLPWKADYRGRITAATSWLTPQGGDVQRALFEFAEGTLLDTNGIDALYQYGGGLARSSLVLESAGQSDKTRPTLEERRSWVEKNAESIIQSANDPVSCAFWRTVSGDPLQFLAFCFAFRSWRENPATPIHLPVQVDGTCNGLQHMAALTGNTPLARAVNVLTGADGRPGDIYTEIARAARAQRTKFKPDGRYAPVFDAAAGLIDAYPQHFLNRGSAKKVIMTVPYGASALRQADYVSEEILPVVLGWWQDPPPVQEWEELVAWACELAKSEGASGRVMLQLKRLNRRRASRLPVGDLRTITNILSVLSACIVGRLRQALAEQFPAIDGFSKWLGKVGSANGHAPLTWFSPMGFPVCQPRFKSTNGSVNIARPAGFGTVAEVSLRTISENAAKNEQKSALLPNLIHSLDATHLLMTVNAAHARGIVRLGTIHDCLLVHPNEAALTGEIVRDTFAQLYSAEANQPVRVIQEWTRWMKLCRRISEVSNPRAVLGLMHGRKPETLPTDCTDLAADISKLGSGERTLAEFLLERRADEAPRAKLQFPEYPFDTPLPVRRGTDLSPYFFS